ncbi:MAG: ISNCY family transposase [Phenylobacterium sp.]|uniref:ISNCY family transposase n=1 Tax=Phenylobacterium sp. TaxID=1871053 RepID=UPI002600F397|nr:ISNCY family transposase [Phenylobacterium sp.]MCA3757895.1 ISNCY family transposase [Phenylobacterium sp.]MCA6244049.1 ISNCY family transposase [Phenylobacterium sp.]MCA6256456.1 ISNCY family transposase [Phenylobacterium sp.]MCA6330230.1 ISNCY family transposase [Phenylobacterium sp.]
MAVRIMSDVELTKFEILRDVDHERLPAHAAAGILGVSERHIWRLLKAYRVRGADGLISRKRGRPSNRRTPADVRLAAMDIVKARYADFGPTLAAEKLHELHDLTVSRETLRAWMIAEGLWQTRTKRQARVYQPRYRRDCVGELIQIDGSEHRWFEDRGPKCTLLVFIDDATSRLMHLQFVESESTFAYFAATRTYLEAHGKPVAFYSDKHSVFRVSKAGVTGDGMTQFGRALSKLKIEIICANSSQAKGRVERANKTLQDRLVKELRLAGINTLADGNAFLPGFVADYNARFGKVPANPKDLHRPMSPRDQLDDEFTWQVDRTLSQSLTLQYDKVLFIIEPSEIAQAAIGKRVTVVDYPDGRIAIRYQGADLAYRTFDKIRKVNQAAVVENKRLGSLLEMIMTYQDSQPQEPRSRKAPKRRDQTGHRFSVG